jgi:hypothetical protein
MSSAAEIVDRTEFALSDHLGSWWLCIAIATATTGRIDHLPLERF